jgi:hypothetical protein
VRTFEVFVARISNDDRKQITFSSVPAEADQAATKRGTPAWDDGLRFRGHLHAEQASGLQLPWLRRADPIHRLTYRRPSQHNIHVRGYKEQGNINTPLELAIRNQTDRFTLAIDAIDRIARLRVTAAGVRQDFLDQQIACEQYAYEHGIDRPDITEWTYPHPSVLGG